MAEQKVVINLATGLEDAERVTIAFLTGLMLGSLRKVWPWKKALSTVVTGDGSAPPPALGNALPDVWTTEVFLALGLMILGAFAIFLLNHLARGEARG